MLIQFSVENFLSFRELTTFSLRATSDARHPHHVFTNEDGQGGKPLGVLRGAAIYGANAAGKSNLVLAIGFAQQLILEGTRPGGTTGVRPFKLHSSSAGKQSRFEFIFRQADVLYSYGFALDANRICEEWLYATPEKHETRLFERVTHADGRVEVNPGPSFVKAVGGRGRVGFLEEGTRANQLFLTECWERNIEALAPVIDWFRMTLCVVRAESRWEPLPVALRVDKRVQNFLSEFLRAAGTGIEGVETQEIPLEWEQLPFADDAERAKLEEDLAEAEPQDGFLVQDENGRRLFLVRGKDGKPCRLQIRTLHRDESGQVVAFRLDEESEGTQRLFHLLPTLLSLQSSSRVLIVDELDRRLHTLLTRLFIQQALECGEDNRSGQLIFTTHDTNLLDLDLLRRDEIWFVEKDRSGMTHLASLAEWKVRPDLEVERGYLNGRFGAIPFFGDVSRLLCESQPAKEEQKEREEDLVTA